MCVGCKGRFPKADLVRFVASAGGGIELDDRGRHPGRGGWLCLRRKCFRLAAENRAFARAFRKAVVVPSSDELWAMSAGRSKNPGPCV
jgi:predicted RNA-binding protein YlxR (DUF448 family)